MPTTGLGFRYPSGTDYAGTGPDVPRAVSELAQDLDAFLTGKYALIKITNIFVGTTTYTPTAGVDGLYVELVAGGGAGGGCISAATNSAAGGGGGGGGYAALWTTTIKTFTVAVGAGGTGVSGAAGGNGGTTSFDSPAICSAQGGRGGGVDTVAAGPRIAGIGGLGGNGLFGDLEVAGHPGMAGISLAAAQTLSGMGGSSHWGGGGPNGGNSTFQGNPGSLYGGGASGGTIISGGIAQKGGDGAAGLIRVWEFQST